VKRFAGSDDACPEEERTNAASAHSMNPSYAGLTRVSITLRKNLSKKMDCRVEPGNYDTVDNSQEGRADNDNRRRYINRARHVRAFGVWIGT
jgi:hypothetical protein